MLNITRRVRCAAEPAARRALHSSNVRAYNSLLCNAAALDAEGDYMRARGFTKAAEALAAHGHEPLNRGKLLHLSGVGRTLSRCIADAIDDDAAAPDGGDDDTAQSLITYDEQAQHYARLDGYVKQFGGSVLAVPVGAYTRAALYARTLRVLVSERSARHGDAERYRVVEKLAQLCVRDGYASSARRSGDEVQLRVGLDPRRGDAVREAMARSVLDGTTRDVALVLPGDERVLHLSFASFDRFYARSVCAAGPPAFVAQLQATAEAKGLRLTEAGGLEAVRRGVFGMERAETVACDSERAVFDAIGVAYVAPMHRGVAVSRTKVAP